MKTLKLSLCFLDEDDNIFVKEDFDVSWKLDENEVIDKVRNVLVMDEVAAMINYQAQENLYAHIRKILDKAKGITDE